jgi:hypothetical protein
VDPGLWYFTISSLNSEARNKLLTSASPPHVNV